MTKSPSAIALGFFDGVHIAHQKIIKAAVDHAKKNNLIPIVLSFDVSPLELLSPEKVRYILQVEEKKRIIENMGAQVEFLPMSAEFLSLSPYAFIENILVKRYNIKYAVCGYDYRFGKGGSGNTEFLLETGKKLGFHTEIIDCETFRGEKISSSRIRELISLGKIKLANKLLGRNFSLRGTVCEGKHLGRTLGFPTANVFFNDSTVIPKKGVYKTLAIIDNMCYNSITNIGTNPTVGGERLRTETYIRNFDDTLYGKEIKIEFLDFIRPEKIFKNIDELKKQIAEDINFL